MHTRAILISELQTRILSRRRRLLLAFLDLKSGWLVYNWIPSLLFQGVFIFFGFSPLFKNSLAG